MAAATCPHCNALIRHVDATAVDAHIGNKRLLSVAFSCAACGVVLGVSPDPLAIKTDTVTELVEALRRAKS